MRKNGRKAFVAVTAFAAAACLVGGFAVVAAPPGTIDGQQIPTDFGGGALVATQTNVTGYGNQTVSIGGFTNGSELDQLYLAKSGGDLKVGISGNWDVPNHVVIFIGGTGGAGLGQTELKAQGVDGPPFTVQTLSQQISFNTNGPGNPSDDTCDMTSNGTVLPCSADYAIGIDTFGGNVSVSEYTLFADSNGTYDCDPGGSGTAFSKLFASRRFVTQTTIADTSENATNPQGVGYDVIGMSNDNIFGVSGVSGAGAATANTGLEMTIPLAALGLTGTETVSMFVMLTSDSAFVSNQAFPPQGGSCTTPGTRPTYSLQPACAATDVNCSGTTDGGDILIVRGSANWLQATGSAGNPRTDVNNSGTVDSGDILVIRGSANWLTSTGPCDCMGTAVPGTCMSVNLNTLPAFGGGDGLSDGNINPADYGAGASSTQSCPTDFGDKQVDPTQVVLTGGTELNELYVTNDADNMYVGITGNVEANGNGVLLFLSTGQPGGMGGAAGLSFTAGGRLNGMSSTLGHFLPLDPADNVIEYDYCYEMNRSASTIWVDFNDLTTNTRKFMGSNDVNSNGSAFTPTTANSNGMLLAYNVLNNDGVPGGQDENTNGVAEVAADAASATYGFELQIPLVDIGITSLPADVDLWAYVVNNDGVWMSNQGLPSLRDPTGTFNLAPGGHARNVHNADNLEPIDFSNDGATTFGPQFGYFARSAHVTLN